MANVSKAAQTASDTQSFTGTYAPIAMNVNMFNFSVYQGRLAADPMISDNADGSKRAFLRVIVPSSRRNQPDVSVAVNVFIQKDNTSHPVFSLAKGDTIQVFGETTSYKDAKTGNWINTLDARGIAHTETKAAKEERLKRQAQA